MYCESEHGTSNVGENNEIPSREELQCHYCYCNNFDYATSSRSTDVDNGSNKHSRSGSFTNMPEDARSRRQISMKRSKHLSVMGGVGFDTGSGLMESEMCSPTVRKRTRARKLPTQSNTLRNYFQPIPKPDLVSTDCGRTDSQQPCTSVIDGGEKCQPSGNVIVINPLELQSSRAEMKPLQWTVNPDDAKPPEQHINQFGVNQPQSWMNRPDVNPPGRQLKQSDVRSDDEEQSRPSLNVTEIKSLESQLDCEVKPSVLAVNPGDVKPLELHINQFGVNQPQSWVNWSDVNPPVLQLNQDGVKRSEWNMNQADVQPLQQPLNASELDINQIGVSCSELGNPVAENPSSELYINLVGIDPPELDIYVGDVNTSDLDVDQGGMNASDFDVDQGGTNPSYLDVDQGGMNTSDLDDVDQGVMNTPNLDVDQAGEYRSACYGLLCTGRTKFQEINFHQLPPNVIENIFCHLPLMDLCLNLTLVCKHWNAIISNPLVSMYLNADMGSISNAFDQFYQNKFQNWNLPSIPKLN